MSIEWIDDTMIAFRRFLSTPDWGQARQVVRENENELLKPMAFEVLAMTEDDPQIWFGGSVPDEKARQAVHTHLAVLNSCRESGIDQTFARLVDPAP
ncbi:hypothetical protein [Kitasatospora sp. NPDC048538]|uniref:hypothetical protein n=1 Tax=unclassified Kitasatospora TaxID=2633591 RepID=UPI0033D4D1EE